MCLTIILIVLYRRNQTLFWPGFFSFASTRSRHHLSRNAHAHREPVSLFVGRAICRASRYGCGASQAWECSDLPSHCGSPPHQCYRCREVESDRRLYKTLLRWDPDNPDLLVRYGAQLLEDKNFEAAFSITTRLFGGILSRPMGMHKSR